MQKPKNYPGKGALTKLKTLAEQGITLAINEGGEEAKASDEQAEAEKEVTKRKAPKVTTPPRARKITLTFERANTEKPRISVGQTSFTIFNARPISIKPKGAMKIPSDIELGAGVIREKSRGKRGRQHIRVD